LATASTAFDSDSSRLDFDRASVGPEVIAMILPFDSMAKLFQNPQIAFVMTSRE
jgi:hypothetical protein